jgi:hypothetical protein
VSGVDFEMDGISYVLIGFDVDMTADELFGMLRRSSLQDSQNQTHQIA